MDSEGKRQVRWQWWVRKISHLFHNHRLVAPQRQMNKEATGLSLRLILFIRQIKDLTETRWHDVTWEQRDISDSDRLELMPRRGYPGQTASSRAFSEGTVTCFHSWLTVSNHPSKKKTTSCLLNLQFFLIIKALSSSSSIYKHRAMWRFCQICRAILCFSRLTGECCWSRCLFCSSWAF